MRFRSLFSSLAPIALLGVGLLLTSQASAAPGVVHYHGYLTDTLGDPIDCPSADVCPSGPVSLTFRLYAEPAGGEPVWEETLGSAPVNDGRLNLLLGKSNPITASALSQEAWLGLSVGDAGELAPRQFLAAVPFAVRAALAQDSAALGGIPAGAYVKTADIPGLCVTEDALTSLLSEAAYLDEEALMDWLQAQGYEPGLHFSGDWAELTGVPEDLQDGDADALGGLDCAPGSVAVYDQGSWACGTDLVLTEDDVDAMVANNGYVLSDLLAQVAITGSYGDLLEIPPALDQLTLTQDGSLTFGDAVIINAAGEWVGSPTGLVGPQGDPGTDGLDGALGTDGTPGTDGQDGVSVLSAGVDEGGILTVTLSDGTIDESPSLMGPTGPKGDQGDPGVPGEKGDQGPPGSNDLDDLDGASLVGVDGPAAAIEATTVQEALEELKLLVDEAASSNGTTIEGAGTISRYANQSGLSVYGTAKEYVRLFHPSSPKIMLDLYGGESAEFSGSPNGNVSNNSTTTAKGVNGYSGGVNGQQGEVTLQIVPNDPIGAGDHILIHQTVGNGPGHWEFNVVESASAQSDAGVIDLVLFKPLKYSYESGNGNDQRRAQVVSAKSYDHFEVTNGGTLKPPSLGGNNDDSLNGGILYIRAQTITVRSGGKITANASDGGGFLAGNNTGKPSENGQSECSIQDHLYSQSSNCSGGGGGLRDPGGACSCGCNGSGGGGGNRTTGGTGYNPYSKGGWAGSAKGSADAATLEFGGGGGAGYHVGGTGGGIVMLGANTIVIESGGVISANGANGSGNPNCYAGGGGGAGGSVVLFANTIDNQGTIEAKGGAGGGGYYDGGDGGEGWVIHHPPPPETVNSPHTIGVEIHIDGEDVTAAIGDQNQKGAGHWHAETETWGGDGTTAWSTGPLDLTNVVAWTPGEHTIEFKETGGAGGELNSYLYLIQPFTESSPPVNDTCGTPVSIELDQNGDGFVTDADQPVVVSGTTEDTMGKTVATNAHGAPGCGGELGVDAAYRIDLSEQSLLNLDTSASYPVRLVLRAGSCSGGDVVACGVDEFITDPIEAGTYYLWIDGDTADAKGDYSFAVSATEAPTPPNDTCEGATPIIHAGQPSAGVTSTSIYSLDDYQPSLCPAVTEDGPDVVYTFDAPSGTPLDITLDADFDAAMVLTKGGCQPDLDIDDCGTSNIHQNFQLGGTYFLFIEGLGSQSWGDFTVTVSFE